MPAVMVRDAKTALELRAAAIAALLCASGCLAPAIAPIHPMTAEAAAISGEREMSGAIGYAAAPGAGLGDSSIPGTPYAEGELRFAVARRVQLTVGAGLAFQRYFLPWLNDLSFGGKLTLIDEPALAFAVAPRVVGATSLNLLDAPGDSGSRSILGTRSLGFELPLLLTHTFENRWSLTLQLWTRYHLLRQEDAVPEQPIGASGAPDKPEPLVSTGHVWGAGGAVMLSFPKLRDSATRYHVFLGLERLWLTQTGSSGGAPGDLHPLVSLSRYSLVIGVGATSPF